MADPSQSNHSAPPGDLDRLLRAIIERSVKHRHAALVLAVLIAAWGLWAAARLSLDVTPDISNLQVQVLTRAPDLSPEEIESSVTRPLELEMFGLPGLEHVRSLTRFGVSQVCLIFAEGTGLYQARQRVAERLAAAAEKLPRGLTPHLAPPSSGLGEVFTYALVFRTNSALPTHSGEARLRRLKLVQEFVVKPCLKSVKGVAEVNTTGGYDQQMVVEVDPATLTPTNAPQLGLDLSDIATLVERNTSVGGGALLERDGQQVLVRSRSRAQTIPELNHLCLKLTWALLGPPLSSIAQVGLGSGVRLGAATLNGQEAVLGTALMLAGENARGVARSVRVALAEAQSRLPADLELRPLYDRAELVDGVLNTVGHNLALAGGLVLAVLLLFLGNGRAALIVAALLLLSFALGVGGMLTLGIVGSLLTLGAMDFGVVVDDAIVMVENVARKLADRSSPDPADGAAARQATIIEACCQVRKPMLVGMLVIIGSYFPILALGGVEGRMFRPLAQALILLLGSSLLLTLTLVPALCALGLGAGRPIREPAFLRGLRSAYEELFQRCRRVRWGLVVLALLLAAGAAGLAPRLGANFLPYLDEGWLVVEVQRDPRISLAASLEMELQTERALRAAVPEIKDLFSRIGMSEIATDPQGVHQNDLYLSFQPRARWRRIGGRRVSKAELGRIIQAVIARSVPGQELELNQPIAVRFDELLEGVRTDLAIKLFGPDYDQLDALAGQIARVVKQIPGAGAVVIDRPGRTEMMEFHPNPALMRKYLAIGDQINSAVSIALAGREVGRIDEGDLFYPLVVRCPESCRTNPAILDTIPVRVGAAGRLAIQRGGRLHHARAGGAPRSRPDHGGKRGCGRVCGPGAGGPAKPGQAPGRLPAGIERGLPELAIGQPAPGDRRRALLPAQSGAGLCRAEECAANRAGGLWPAVRLGRRDLRALVAWAAADHAGGHWLRHPGGTEPAQRDGAHDVFQRAARPGHRPGRGGLAQRPNAAAPGAHDRVGGQRRLYPDGPFDQSRRRIATALRDRGDFRNPHLDGFDAAAHAPLAGGEKSARPERACPGPSRLAGSALGLRVGKAGRPVAFEPGACSRRFWRNCLGEGLKADLGSGSSACICGRSRTGKVRCARCEATPRKRQGLTGSATARWIVPGNAGRRGIA